MFIGVKFGFSDVIRLFLAYGLFYLILYFHYEKFIIPYFYYEGFHLSFSLNKFLLSIYIIFLISITFYHLDKHRPSTHLFNVLIFVSVIPMLVLYSMENLSSLFVLYVVISIFIVRMVLNIKFPFKRLKVVPLRFLNLVAFSLAFFLILCLLFLNWKYFNLDILKVYEYRHIVSNNTPKILSYLYNVTFKGLIPILFLFFLFHEKSFSRRVIVSVLVMIIYVLIFGLTSQKFYLFLIPFMMFLFFLSRISDDMGFTLLVFFFIFLTSFLFLGECGLFFIVKSLVLQRIIFLPAEINFQYYNFFSKNPFVFFSDSRILPIGYFITYPYNLGVPFLIGKEIFGHPEMSANTGWIGSGYAHAGFGGMVLYAVIIGILFKYLDFMSNYLDYRFVVISFFPYVIMLFLSTDLKTTFVTDGLAVYLLLLNVLAFNNQRILYNLDFKRR